MISDPARFRLNRHHASLLVIDVQERLASVMEPGAFAEVVENLVRWIEGAKVLGLPILWTEQYVKGLGPTIPRLREAMPAGAVAAEKLAFSCLSIDRVRAALQARGQVIAVGLETHVCVFQTVRDLEALGVRTFVPADAVISRTRANRETGLAVMRALGATVISTELGLFDLTETSGTEEFKQISKLVK